MQQLGLTPPVSAVMPTKAKSRPTRRATSKKEMPIMITTHPAAANDNVLASPRAILGRVLGLFKAMGKRTKAVATETDVVRQARKKGTTLAFYEQGGNQVIATFRLCPKEAEEHGLKAGDIVTVEKTGQGYIIRPATKGVTVRQEKFSLSIRVRGLSGTPAPAVPVRLSSAKKGGVLVRHGTMRKGTGKVPSSSVFPLSFLDDFKSLYGVAGEMRRAFLAANDNEQQKKATTSAGDQCYTAIFLIMAILRAAKRKMFAIDCCSMRSDGRYDLELDPAIIKAGTWPSPVNPGVQLQVIGAVPAERHMTKEDSEMGSLLLPWIGDFIFLNSTYSKRTWVVFLEKAAKEVAAGRAGIIVALVPMDTYGPHIRHMFDENAYRIELSEKVPFFMKRKVRKDGTIDENIIETTKGNALVVFGKGTKTRDFLVRLVRQLRAIGYITEEQAKHYRQLYAVWPKLQKAA